MLEIQKERPAYVTFELKAVEDREASIKAGHYVAKEVPFVYITPPGSKDRVERNALEWLEQMAEQVKQERLPREFFNHYKQAYEDWKTSGEIPVNGTPVKTCPLFSVSQVDALLKANIRTVEDLASANEESIGRLGMGGRALKQQATDWLAAASGTGKTASELTALKQQNKELSERNAALETQLAALAAKVDAIENSKPTKAL